MSANPELSEAAREVLHPPLTWPGPILKGVQKLWQNVSGQRAAYETGLGQGIDLAARIVAHRINNQIGPVGGYAELLLRNPSIQRDKDAKEFINAIIEAGNAVVNTVRLLNRVRRITLDTRLNTEYKLLDLEASAREKD